MLPAGCAGVRPLGPDVCELKRLFVRPAYRGRGLARQLSTAALAEARARDYRRIRLDTLPGMVEAQRLYRDLGFRRSPPTGRTPCPARVFMELALTRVSRGAPVTGRGGVAPALSPAYTPVTLSVWRSDVEA